MKYLIIIEPTATGYSAYSPDLPGCVSTGATREEVEHNMREAIEFRSLKLVEQPIGDYGCTIARQFLFDVYNYNQMEHLCESKFEKLSAIAAKAVKEARYHLRHSREWVLRMGDGTEESHRRI